jgi:hypothetical protein
MLRSGCLAQLSCLASSTASHGISQLCTSRAFWFPPAQRRPIHPSQSGDRPAKDAGRLRDLCSKSVNAGRLALVVAKQFAGRRPLSLDRLYYYIKIDLRKKSNWTKGGLQDEGPAGIRKRREETKWLMNRRLFASSMDRLRC